MILASDSQFVADFFDRLQHSIPAIKTKNIPCGLNGYATIELACGSSFTFKDFAVQLDDSSFKVGAKSVLLITKVEVLDLSIATYQISNLFYTGDSSTTLLAIISQELQVKPINVVHVAYGGAIPTDSIMHTPAHSSPAWIGSMLTAEEMKSLATRIVLEADRPAL